MPSRLFVSITAVSLVALGSEEERRTLHLLEEGNAVDEHADAVEVPHVQLEGGKAVENRGRKRSGEAVEAIIVQGVEGVRTARHPIRVVKGGRFP